MRPLGTGPGQAIIVVGLGFGDEAKGATVDHLAWRIPDTTAVVRWSGGVQTAHNRDTEPFVGVPVHRGLVGVGGDRSGGRRHVASDRGSGEPGLRPRTAHR